MKALTNYLNKIKKAVIASSFVALAFAITGCPGDDGGTRVGTPITGSVHTCQGVCPVSTTDSLIRKAFGDDVINGLRSQLTLDILGDDVFGTGPYTGNVYLAGSYYVEQSNFPGCPVYTGRYNIETAQAGQMNSNGFFGNVQVIARGVEGAAASHTLHMTIASLSTGAFSRTKYNISGLPYDFGLTGNVQITQVDSNYNCQNAFMFFSYLIN